MANTKLIIGGVVGVVLILIVIVCIFSLGGTKSDSSAKVSSSTFSSQEDNISTDSSLIEDNISGTTQSNTQRNAQTGSMSMTGEQSSEIVYSDSGQVVRYEDFYAGDAVLMDYDTQKQALCATNTNKLRAFGVVTSINDNKTLNIKWLGLANIDPSRSCIGIWGRHPNTTSTFTSWDNQWLGTPDQNPTENTDLKSNSVDPTLITRIVSPKHNAGSYRRGQAVKTIINIPAGSNISNCNELAVYGAVSRFDSTTNKYQVEWYLMKTTSEDSNKVSNCVWLNESPEGSYEKTMFMKPNQYKDIDVFASINLLDDVPASELSAVL